MTRPANPRGDPRRRFIDLLEQEATAAGCDTAPHFARHVAARMEALGLHVLAEPDPGPPETGRPVTADAVPEYVTARRALKENPP